MRLSKKAISPLVATIILIVFSIGLGAVVMSFGETYIEDSADFAKGVSELEQGCEDVELEIISVKGAAQVCSKNGKVEVFLEGGNYVDIQGIQANLIGADGVDIKTNILKSPLAKTQAQKIAFSYDSASVGELLQIKLTPLLGETDARTVCSDKALVLEDLGAC